ncbi:MAG: hypothetical protein DRQ10_08985, partial [Candidatus Hydrothermota bacterium]
YLRPETEPSAVLEQYKNVLQTLKSKIDSLDCNHIFIPPDIARILYEKYHYLTNKDTDIQLQSLSISDLKQEMQKIKDRLDDIRCLDTTDIKTIPNELPYKSGLPTITDFDTAYQIFTDLDMVFRAGERLNFYIWRRLYNEANDDLLYKIADAGSKHTTYKAFVLKLRSRIKQILEQIKHDKDKAHIIEPWLEDYWNALQPYYKLLETTNYTQSLQKLVDAYNATFSNIKIPHPELLQKTQSKPKFTSETENTISKSNSIPEPPILTERPNFKTHADALAYVKKVDRFLRAVKRRIYDLLWEPNLDPELRRQAFSAFRTYDAEVNDLISTLQSNLRTRQIDPDLANVMIEDLIAATQPYTDIADLLEYEPTPEDLAEEVIMRFSEAEPPTSHYLLKSWTPIEKIVRRCYDAPSKWCVYSEKKDPKTGKRKKLGGPYDTKQEALKRLRQIEYFKRINKARRRPPKSWFDRCVESVKRKNKNIKDPAALCAWIWYYWMSPSAKRKYAS